MHNLPYGRSAHGVSRLHSNELLSAHAFGACSITANNVDSVRDIKCIKLESMHINISADTAVRTIIETEGDENEPSAYFHRREDALRYAEYLSLKSGFPVLAI